MLLAAEAVAIFWGKFKFSPLPFSPFPFFCLIKWGKKVGAREKKSGKGGWKKQRFFSSLTVIIRRVFFFMQMGCRD